MLDGPVENAADHLPGGTELTHPASAGRRAAAACVDTLLFFVLHLVTMALVIGYLSVTSAATLACVYTLWLVLFGSPEVLGEGTIGKRLLGLAVRDATGAAAPRGRLALRWTLKALPVLAFFVSAFAVLLGSFRVADHHPLIAVAVLSLSGVFFFAGLADFLFVVGASRRALRDRVAGTIVVRTSES